jgi:hypothetical protein
LGARETRPLNARYQSSEVVSNSGLRFSEKTPINLARSDGKTCIQNVRGISDAKLLFQLAVALAAAYLLFLAAWFWGTRERRARVGSAARY